MLVQLISTEKCCTLKYALRISGHVIANCIHEPQAWWVNQVDGNPSRRGGGKGGNANVCPKPCAAAVILRFTVTVPLETR